jgi:CubicO group peptidase (beta-lactamase class C family)
LSITSNLSALDAFLSSKRRVFRLPGLAVAVVQDGHIVYQRGLGAAGSKHPMTAQTPLIIGSLSKSFTALAVMQLVERGLLNLDETVQHYIPWFCLADSGAAASITLRHLLTHTSGISKYAGRVLLGGHGGKTIERSVRDLRGLRLSQPVGAGFQYSNTNYLVLGLVVEVVSGQSFADYIQQHIFNPLGMHHSHASFDTALRGGLASGHRWWFGIPLPYRAPYLPDAVPAAFIAASCEDMARYALALLGGGTLDGASVLSPAGVAALHRPATVTASPGSCYGLGWRIEKLGGAPLYRHGGEVSNFMGEMVLVPSRNLGVIVLVNVGNGLIPAVVPDVSRMASGVARFLLGIPAPRRRLSLGGFYALLDVVLGVLSAYQGWSLVQLFRRSGASARRGRSALGLAALVEVVLGAAAARSIPRWASSPWSLLGVYVPDVTAWLAAFFGCSLVKCLVSLFGLLRRSRL